jgi:hypothetical protein
MENKKTKIIDYLGNQQIKSECVLIGGMYYKKGKTNQRDSGDVFEINGTKYRLSNNKIIWFYDEGCYIVKESLSFNNVIFIVDGKNEIAAISKELAFSTGDLYIPVMYNHYDGDRTLYYINDKLIEKLGFIYNFSRGVVEKRTHDILSSNNHRPCLLRSKPTYATLPTDIYNTVDYPFDKIIREFDVYYKNSIQPHPLDKFFNLTYGLEIETQLGWFPEGAYYQNYCIPLKDGSIKGTEITTLKYSNEIVNSVINYTKRLAETCQKYTRCDANNSFHVNIGVPNSSMEFRVALFNLYTRLENELERFTPKYKRDLNYLVTKPGGPKDHCQLMPYLGFDTIYNQIKTGVNYQTWLDNCDRTIFEFLNNGQSENSTNNRKNRKHVAEGQPKWEHTHRYYTLNLENLYFGNEKGARIEYRVHSGTVNPTKIMMWLFITNGITQYALKNANYILNTKNKIILEDVLQDIYGENIAHTILLYIKERTQHNIRAVMNNNVNQIDEFNTDHVYNMKIGGKDALSILLNEPTNQGA